MEDKEFYINAAKKFASVLIVLICGSLIGNFIAKSALLGIELVEWVMTSIVAGMTILIAVLALILYIYLEEGD